MEPAAREVMDMARGVLGELDVETVLTRVLESARALTDARYAALGVLDPTRRHLERFLTLGVDEATAHRIGTRPTGRGVLGELIWNPRPLRLASVGAHPRSYGFPPEHPPMGAFLGVPLLIGGEPYGNLYLTEKRDGEEFSEEDQEALLMLADIAGLAIDHARRYSDADQERIQLRRTVEALEATTEITRALAGQTDVDAILELVAKRGRALIEARLLLIEVVSDDELVVTAGAGEMPPGFIGTRVAVANTVASAAIGSRRVHRLSDQLNWTRFHQYGVGRFGLDAHDGLVVPMIFRGTAYGVLVAIDRLRDGPAFTAEHERLLESCAARAAAADMRHRLAMEAAEAERTRWARELHDETLQAIAAAKLLLSSARRSEDPEAMKIAIGEAVEQLQQDMDNLRALIADLRPGALDQLGVEAAIADLTGRLARTGLEIDVDVDLAHEQGEEPQRLVPELETAVYRTVQEALSNIVKHSGATQAVVEVIERGREILVKVRDNGQGFDTTQRTDGFGLAGMRERVELLEGTLRVNTEPGRGTTIEAVFAARHCGDARSAAAGTRLRLAGS
jgi:signal transduction histidine kinase